MSQEAAFESDVSIGLALVLGVLAVGSAMVTLFAPGTVVAGFGFAGAMTLGALLIVALHVTE
jgi:hypothetical protein